MFNHSRYSKTIHIVVFLSFFLPFFYTGCGPSNEEKAKKEKALTDSIVEVEKAKVKAEAEKAVAEADSMKQKDSIMAAIDSAKAENETKLNDSMAIAAAKKVDSTVSNNDSPLIPKSPIDDKTLADKIANRVPFLAPVLVPKEDTYTGIASVINLIVVTEYIAIYISFLLLLICFTIKFIDKEARKTIVLLDVLATVLLFISRAENLTSHILYGYWLAFSFAVVLTVYDFYVMRINKQK
jgi:hypothetical protein